MPVPDFHKLMLPALQALSDGEERPTAAIYERMADKAGLDDASRSEVMPNSGQARYKYRGQWALNELAKAGLVNRVRTGVYRISTAGTEFLATGPSEITRRLLRSFDAYREATARRKSAPQTDSGAQRKATDSKRGVAPDPEYDRFASAIAEALAARVRREVRVSSASCLDRLATDLMVALGYSRCDEESSGKGAGASHDTAGGSLWQDPLGLAKVYLKTEHAPPHIAVSEQTLREFAATMLGTDQGLLVTTSTFSPVARNYVQRSPMRIALIDGERLAQLLVKHGSWKG